MLKDKILRTDVMYLDLSKLNWTYPVITQPKALQQNATKRSLTQLILTQFILSYPSQTCIADILNEANNTKLTIAMSDIFQNTVEELKP